jgi:hypothetical protein
LSQYLARRRIDSELTVAIDRSALPPISTTCLESVGLDPEHPETKAMMVRAQEGPGDRPTLMPCCCCKGTGMVTPQRYAELLEHEPDVLDSDDLEEE